MKGIRTITIRQRDIRKLQRRIAKHKAELAVHRDHLVDINQSLCKVISRVDNAMAKLTAAAEALDQ